MSRDVRTTACSNHLRVVANIRTGDAVYYVFHDMFLGNGFDSIREVTEVFI